MNLYTKSKDPGWDRTVFICVDRCDGVSSDVCDTDSYKIVLLNKGSLSVGIDNVQRRAIAPSVILAGNEAVTFTDLKNVSMTVVYFKPTEVRDEFETAQIGAGVFENQFGKTIYQDYLLIKDFTKYNETGKRVLNLSPSFGRKLSKLADCISDELSIQADGYWPCRSRSFLMELLYNIKYICDEDKSEVEEQSDSELVGEIMQYLSEHIADRITVADISKHFSINRNRLNDIFVKETSETCINYLIGMRMKLAQIMLTDTQLQIGEIADRVGYDDPNYFVKAFKKYASVTPSSYRKQFTWMNSCK